MKQADINTRQMMADTKFFESYARYIEKENRYETWNEGVDRVMNMHRQFYADKLTDELEFYLRRAENLYKNKHILGAQRVLQFGGEQIIKHQMKVFNCTSSYADRPEFFGEIFYVLLCGCGAGFSVQKHHISRIPKIVSRFKQAKTFVVEDSIEGWAAAVDVLLSSFFENGGKHPEYAGRRVYFDLNSIRQKNAYISGGFKAPGPEPLRRALGKIEGKLSKIAEENRQMRPIEVYDIVMFIADAVISGGVRRSATICLFSHDDHEMAGAKTGNWFEENPQRGRSNNSAIILRHLITRSQFDLIMSKVKEFGEPGFLFVDSLEHCTNPCVEIGMLPQYEGKSGWQGCNLTEINGALCNSPEDFYRLCEGAAILGTLQGGYTDFTFLTETTKNIFQREALLGVSITGWMNNPTVLFNKDVLQKGAKIVKETNKKIAKLIDINAAARTTCVKPSGNASVLLQTASGIHAEHAKRYIRHVQLNKNSEVAQLIKKKNPRMVEDSVWSEADSDYVISFPIETKDGSLYRKDMMGINQLEKVKLVQKYWVEAGVNVDLCVDKTVRHNVSNTITVDDWDECADYIFENRNYFSGISFMSDFGDKSFNQAPFSEVLSSNDLMKKYGVASMFASGLIVDGMSAFNNNLWSACAMVKEMPESLVDETTADVLRKDWIRRFEKFSNNYFGGNLLKTEECLKDVYLIHKWYNVTNTIKDIDWASELGKKEFTAINTLGAIACHAGACEIDF